MDKLDQLDKLPKKSTRDGFGEGLLELGQKNPKVIVLSADLSESTRSIWFKEKFPKRFIEMGVAEQNMIGVAAGLAQEGKIPICTSFAVFSPGCNWEQIRVSVCYNKANVKIASTHGGLATGPDGATHQALEDIAITRCLPNLKIIVPCDCEEARKAIIAACAVNDPVYLRFTRQSSPVITSVKNRFAIGRAEILLNGRDLTIIACGPIIVEALLAAKILRKKGIYAKVINNHTIKPIDRKTVIKSARETGAVVTVEDHQFFGGLGSAVAEVITQNYPVPQEFVGVKDKFGESGSADDLWEKYKLNHIAIIKAAKKVLKRKKD